MQALILAVVLALQADPEWKAGLAEEKITPEEPLLLSGYAARKKPFQGVAADLFIKALAPSARSAS